MALVLFLNDNPLLISEYVRDADGKVCRGWVDNGAWEFEISNGAVRVSGTNLYRIHTYEEVTVSGRGGDYNEIIARAIRKKEQRNDEA